jgi:gluconolactonase
VWFTDLKDLSSNTPTSILRYDIATDMVDIMVDDSGGANGLAFDPEGRLLAALWHNGSLTRRPVNDLTNVTVLADAWQEVPLRAPNDIAVAADGGIYFIDQDGQGVYYLSRDGDLTLAARASRSNGIALSPDGETLYVVAASNILSFNVPDDGMLTKRQVFASPGGFFDGLTTDRFGNLYALHMRSFTDHQVLIWNEAGEELLAFELPEPGVNATFASDDMLYITGLTSLYRVPIAFVPEPTTSALLLLGIFGIHMSFRHRRPRLA